jgi:hypothetical protein
LQLPDRDAIGDRIIGAAHAGERAVGCDAQVERQDVNGPLGDPLRHQGGGARMHAPSTSARRRVDCQAMGSPPRECGVRLPCPTAGWRGTELALPRRGAGAIIPRSPRR